MKAIYTSGTCAQSVDRSGLLCLSPTFFTHHLEGQAVVSFGRSWGDGGLQVFFPRGFLLRSLACMGSRHQVWPTLVEEMEVRHA
jgi:hypothetical protein